MCACKATAALHVLQVRRAQNITALLKSVGAIYTRVARMRLQVAEQKLVLAYKPTRKKRMDKRHYPKLNNYASSGLGFLKKLAMDGWFAGAAGPFFGPASLGL